MKNLILGLAAALLVVAIICSGILGFFLIEARSVVEAQEVQLSEQQVELEEQSEYIDFLLEFGLDSYSGFANAYSCWYESGFCESAEDMDWVLDYWFYEIDDHFDDAPGYFEDDLFDNQEPSGGEL